MNYHQPVLENELIEGLNIRPGDIVVDLTLGGGGYVRRILNNCPGVGLICGIDRDMDAINYVSETLKTRKLLLIHGNFNEMSKLLMEHKINTVNKVIIDLGVSSFQIDQPDRGFAYSTAGPIDMRMNRNQSKTAQQVIQKTSEIELADMIYKFGEEPASRKIAQTLKHRVKMNTLTTTEDLSDAVRSVIKGTYQRRMTAVRRVFQALRIATNDELSTLSNVLPQVLALLETEGRLAVITYHSLEDRIVKHWVRDQKDPLTGQRIIRQYNKKPIVPSAEEINQNPRSKSAKLRILIKQ